MILIKKLWLPLSFLGLQLSEEVGCTLPDRPSYMVYKESLKTGQSEIPGLSLIFGAIGGISSLPCQASHWLLLSYQNQILRIYYSPVLESDNISHLCPSETSVSQQGSRSQSRMPGSPKDKVPDVSSITVCASKHRGCLPAGAYTFLAGRQRGFATQRWFIDKAREYGMRCIGCIRYRTDHSTYHSACDT